MRRRGHCCSPAADTLAHYEQVLRTVTFSSTSENPTDFGDHTIPEASNGK